MGSQVQAQEKPPIQIGLGVALTGPSASGKAALVSMQIAVENINQKDVLLGRKVEILAYDDQSQISNVPGLYTKLLDIDVVDSVVSDYGTNLIVPAMPTIMSIKMLFFGLFGLAANSNFNYERHFGIQLIG